MSGGSGAARRSSLPRDGCRARSATSVSGPVTAPDPVIGGRGDRHCGAGCCGAGRVAAVRVSRGGRVGVRSAAGVRGACHGAATAGRPGRSGNPEQPAQRDYGRRRSRRGPGDRRVHADRWPGRVGRVGRHLRSSGQTCRPGRVAGAFAGRRAARSRDGRFGAAGSGRPPVRGRGRRPRGPCPQQRRGRAADALREAVPGTGGGYRGGTGIWGVRHQHRSLPLGRRPQAGATGGHVGCSVRPGLHGRAAAPVGAGRLRPVVLGLRTDRHRAARAGCRRAPTARAAGQRG